jgi:hypothetical protein
MKLALLLTGHQRQYQYCYPSIKQFLLDKHDVDVYISTWDHNYFSGTPVPADPTPVIELYKPVKCHIEGHINYYQNKITMPYINGPVDYILHGQPKTMQGCECHPGRDCARTGCIAVESLRDQWYMVMKGFELIENQSQYDYIMKLRLDIKFDFLHIRENVPKGTIIVPGYHNIIDVPDFVCCDHVAYGHPEDMGKYCHFYEFYGDAFVKKMIPAFMEYAIGYYLKFQCGIVTQMDELGLKHSIAPKN